LRAHRLDIARNGREGAGYAPELFENQRRVLPTPPGTASAGARVRAGNRFDKLSVQPLRQAQRGTAPAEHEKRASGALENDKGL